MIDMRAVRVLSLALALFTLTVVALPSDARGGSFKTDRLQDCVGYTRE